MGASPAATGALRVSQASAAPGPAAASPRRSLRPAGAHPQGEPTGAAHQVALQQVGPPSDVLAPLLTVHQEPTLDLQGHGSGQLWEGSPAIRLPAQCSLWVRVR